MHLRPFHRSSRSRCLVTHWYKRLLTLYAQWSRCLSSSVAVRWISTYAKLQGTETRGRDVRVWDAFIGCTIRSERSRDAVRRPRLLQLLLRAADGAGLLRRFHIGLQTAARLRCALLPQHVSVHHPHHHRAPVDDAAVANIVRRKEADGGRWPHAEAPLGDRPPDGPRRGDRSRTRRTGSGPSRCSAPTMPVRNSMPPASRLGLGRTSPAKQRSASGMWTFMPSTVRPAPGPSTSPWRGRRHR